jgi:hypothetical protein
MNYSVEVYSKHTEERIQRVGGLSLEGARQVARNLRQRYKGRAFVQVIDPKGQVV